MDIYGRKNFSFVAQPALAQDVDFDGRKARFAGPDGASSGSVAYDLLIGADGANSAVRRLMQVRAWGPSAHAHAGTHLRCCRDIMLCMEECAAGRVRPCQHGRTLGEPWHGRDGPGGPDLAR